MRLKFAQLQNLIIKLVVTVLEYQLIPKSRPAWSNIDWNLLTMTGTVLGTQTLSGVSSRLQSDYRITCH